MKSGRVAQIMVWGCATALLGWGCTEKQTLATRDAVSKEAASLVRIIAEHGQGDFARRVREQSCNVPEEGCVGMLLEILSDPTYAAELRAPDTIPTEYPFYFRHNRSRMLGFCVRQLYALAFLDYVGQQKGSESCYPQELDCWLAVLVRQRALPEGLLYDPLLYTACRKEMLKRGQAVQALAEEEKILYPELLTYPGKYKRLTADFIQYLKAL